jgi:hypothetical protein
VAVAAGVEDLKLGTGVGPLAAHDQPRALGPAGEVDVVGQLGDLGALAFFALGVDRLLPSRLGQVEDRLAHPLVDLIADREVDARLAAVGGEGMGAPADVGARQDLAVKVCLRQLLEGQLQNLEVIGGGIGTGVAGTQDPSQGLTGLREVTEQRKEAEAALVGAGGALLLGVGAEEGGVDIEINSFGRAPASQARFRALERAARSASSISVSIDLITRWAVLSEATAPNRVLGRAARRGL